MQRLFSTREELKAEANRVLQQYANKRVNDMMYQLRVDAVKLYFFKVRGEKIKDEVARTIELSDEEYLLARVEWVSESDWPSLCHHWDTEQYLEKRKKAQDSRLQSEDDSRNRGGSRPFTETQQWLAHDFGPEKATGLNTFGVMKSGAKNVDSTGTHGRIDNQKAEKIMADYTAVTSSGTQGDSDGHELDPKALYSICNGLPHGRLPIGNGAVSKSTVIAAGKETAPRPSTPSANQTLRNENLKLTRENAELRRRMDSNERLIRVRVKEVIVQVLSKLNSKLHKEDERRGQGPAWLYLDRVRRQFKYVNWHAAEYKYTSQLGVILKREYPGTVKDLDNDGRIIRSRPALHWADYYLKENEEYGETCAERVRLFSTREELKAEANRVLQQYANKRVNDMMYQLRVDAVKLYFFKVRGEKIKDEVARTIELSDEEYLLARVEWVSESDWPSLCHHWDIEQYLEKRKKAQDSRLQSEDDSRNRGGSRPFTETQQWLAHDLGPEKATGLNTFGVMKSGAKNVDSTGTHGRIDNQKAEKIMADYTAVTSSGTQGDSDGHELDPKALYSICNGLPHGRLPIGNGAVSKSTVIAAFLYEKTGVEPPSEEDVVPPANEDLMSPAHVQRTGSSHAGSQQEAENDGTTDTNMGSEENVVCEVNIGCEANNGCNRNQVCSSGRAIVA
ncbi:hypothetical protein OsI_07601 [Oryza sativa Indica Group]|uniref:Uncharacterized protein n=1 Tax=Oryza sativa subsp. indica TaxID=39946 RepID=B8AJC9_ORYSI|nr:hypothetical protein OsI_07601 [Oryza sativa Indica Group]